MTERVLGIGGLFFRSRDPDGLARWYDTHLGVTPDRMLAGTLAGVEMGLDLAAVPRAGSGVAAALAQLAEDAARKTTG